MRASLLSSSFFFSIFTRNVPVAQKAKDPQLVHIWLAFGPNFLRSHSFQSFSGTLVQYIGSRGYYLSLITMRHSFPFQHALSHIQQYSISLLCQPIMLRCIGGYYFMFNSLAHTKLMELL